MATTGLLVGLDSGGVGAAASQGTASATAQSYRVNPQTGALSLGISFGTTLTNYTNKVAIAEARGIDLGIIGQLLAAQGCSGGDPTLPADKQPKPAHVEARNEQKDVSATNSDEGLYTKTVHATDQPFADSVVTGQPLSAAGLFDIGPSRSESISRYLPDGTREAIATVDLASVSLGPAAAPLASLKSLHWEVKVNSGTRTAQTMTFTVGTAAIGGVPLPASDVSALLKAVNQATSALGIQITPPKSRSGAGFYYVDPLVIAVVPNATRDQVLGTILSGAQPVRGPVIDALLKANCSLASPITVGDVVVGSVSGAGSLGLELGGVHASSGDITTFEFPALPPLPSLPDIPASFAQLPDSSPISVPGGITSAIAPPPVLRSSPRSIQPAAKVSKTRGGKLALASAIALALIALTIELDRRKMRHAQLAGETGD